jgi:hypothetical protein
MPIESKECFTDLTLDGQLYEILQAVKSSANAIQSTYYKTTQQNLINGSTDITFDGNAPWNNSNNYITHATNSADFVVVKSGLYNLEWNASVAANGATWNVGNNKVISIDITRSPIAEQVTIAQTALTATTQSYVQSVSSTFYLEAGDIINLRIQGNFATAVPFVQPIGNSFDLNTWFSWRYASTISVGATGAAPLRGQAGRITDGTITGITQGVYQSTGLVANFDSPIAAGMSLGTTDTFALKNTSGSTRVFRFYGSYDGTAGNNQMLGIKLAKNGVIIDETECRAFTGSNLQEGKQVTSWIIEMDNNDEVAVYVANLSGTNNIIMKRGRILATSVDQ